MAKTGSTILSFLMGAVVGAVVALLYAPTSGEELRGQIRSEADARVEQLSEEWEKAMAEMQASIEKTRSDVMAYLEQMQEQESQDEAAKADVVVEVEVSEEN